MTVVEVGSAAGSSTLRAVVGLLRRHRGGDLADVTLVRRGVTVDRSHLAAYDRVCGFRLSDQLPPTYPHVLAFPLAMRLLTDPGFPFPAIGLVHVANRITVSGPLDAGSAYDLSVRATHLRAHERGRQVDIVATATRDGAEVWTSVSTYLSKEKPARRDPASERASGRTSDVAAAPGAGDTPERVGASGSTPAASAVWRVPARVGTDYAEVSGDHNPIHTSRIGARLFGFPRPIAHGMWSLARCLSALEGRLPERYTVDVGFRRPILLPARVSFAWQHPPGAAGPAAADDSTSNGPPAPDAADGPSNAPDASSRPAAVSPEASSRPATVNPDATNEPATPDPSGSDRPGAISAGPSAEPVVASPGSAAAGGGTFLLFGKKTHLAGQVTPE